MSRWINADDLIEDFKNDLMNSRMEALRGNPHDSILISNVIERIQDAPTVFSKQTLILEFLPDKTKTIWCPFDEEWSAFYQTFTRGGV